MTRGAEPPSGRLLRRSGLALSIAAVAAAAWVVASTLWALLQSRWLGPVNDFWLFVPQLAAHDRGEPLWDLLWNAQGGHRMPFPRLLYLAEYRLFGASNVFLVTLSVALQALGAALLARFVWRHPGGLSRTERVFLCACAVVLLFSATQIENFSRGWNVHHFLCCQAVLWALLACAKAAEARQRDAAPTGRGWLAVAVACGVLASFSMAIGLAVWPILVVLAARARLPAVEVAAVALAGAAVLAGFFAGHPIGAGPAGEAFVSDPLRVLAWARACLGGPLSWSHLRGGAWLASAALGAVVLAGVRFLLPGRRPHPLEAPYLGLAVFGVGAALFAALGRLEKFPASWDARRYQTFVGLFWIGIIGLGVLHSAGAGWRRALRAVLSAAVAAWLGGVLLPAHDREAAALPEHAAEVRAAHDAILVGVTRRKAYGATIPRTATTSDKADPVQLSRGYLEAGRLGMFAPGRHERLGVRVTDHFAVAPEAECEGELNGFRFFGHSAQLDGRMRGEHELLVVDASGTVTGLGRARRKGIVRSETTPRRWTAWARAAPGARVEVFALLDEGRVCRIAGPLPLQAGRAGPASRR